MKRDPTTVHQSKDTPVVRPVLWVCVENIPGAAVGH